MVRDAIKKTQFFKWVFHHLVSGRFSKPPGVKVGETKTGWPTTNDKTSLKEDIPNN